MRASQEYVHGVQFLPSWRTPHSFLVFGESLEPWLASAPDDEPQQLAQTRFAFTTGLLVHEVAAAGVTTAEGMGALCERVGFEWLGQLADGLRDGAGTSELTKWLRRKRVGIPTPGLPPSAFVLGREVPRSVPGLTLERFVGAESTRLQRFQASLTPFVRELVRAAEAGDPPALDNHLNAALRERASLQSASPALTSAGWALQFGSLERRLWWELFELFEVRPAIHLCPLCRRIYVPRTAAQKRCQRGLYAYPDGEPLRGCSPLPQLDADRHRREYKRLSEAVRRARRTHNKERSKASGAKLTKAQEALDTYRQRHYGRAGRPPKGEPHTLIGRRS